MNMASVQATKKKHVDEILANKTYMPNSGVYLRLRSVLLKLAKDDLATLKMIVELKVAEGATDHEANRTAEFS